MYVEILISFSHQSSVLRFLQIKCDFYGGTEQEFSAMKTIDEQVSSLLRLGIIYMT
jgi:hypothetical protein